MGIQLKELISQVDCGDIQLVAGKNGYSNPVDWVHMVDNTEIAEFLVGGEVAFTTGIGIREDMTLLMLVESIYKKKASGMVINVGPYIREISKEVIDFSNAHNFPVFEVPWRVHMADIMRIFCFEIQRSEQREMELAAAFRYAVFAPKQEELYVAELMQKGYLPKWNYVVSILDIYDKMEDGSKEAVYIPVLNERLNVLKKRIADLVMHDKQDASVFIDNGRMVLVLSDIQEADAVPLVEKVKIQLTYFLKPTETVFAGVGNTVHGFRYLSESYKMAGKIIDMSKTEHADMETRCYSAMGINRLLFHIEDQQCLENYYNDTIKPLEEYDAVNGSNLIEVLECYMKHNGSVQKTAEELYVHRNTVNYKLRKIESLLHTELAVFSVRNELAVGLLAAKILRCMR